MAIHPIIIKIFHQKPTCWWGYQGIATIIRPHPLVCTYFMTIVLVQTVEQNEVQLNSCFSRTTTPTEGASLKMNCERLEWCLECLLTGSWDTHAQESEVLMLMLLEILSSFLLLANLDQSHFTLLLQFCFDSQSQHCAAGMKSCTARPGSINKLSRPEGCVCVSGPFSCDWSHEYGAASGFIQSLTHHAKQKIRLSEWVCLPSRLDQLNYKPWTSMLSGEAYRNAGGGEPGLAGGSLECV